MIIAHGPLGYLLAYSTRRWWQDKLTAQQRNVVYLVAFIGGIFPDADLFYYYLVDSTVSHRQLLPHSAVPYVLLILLGIVFLFVLPKLRFYAWLILAFSVGGLSHLAADMLVGMAAVFNPLSLEMYGLVSNAWYRDSWFMRYNLVTNFTLEFMIIMIAAGTFIRKRSWWLVSAAGTIAVTGLLVWLNLHNHKPDGYFYYSDQDNDGLMNAYDPDLDGDGLPNFSDMDIDQDGTANRTELERQLITAEGSLFDYSYGNFIEVPLRIGLVNSAVLINRTFANVGLFFGEEMTTDYQQNPAGYLSAPHDNTFSETPANWLIWLDHTQRLFSADTELASYDMIFFNSGHVAIYLQNQNNVGMVLDVHPTHAYSSYLPLTQVVEREQGIQAVGRIMPQ